MVKCKAANKKDNILQVDQTKMETERYETIGIFYIYYLYRIYR